MPEKMVALMCSRYSVHIYMMNEVPELLYSRLADVVTPLWRLSYEEQLKVGAQLVFTPVPLGEWC